MFRLYSDQLARLLSQRSLGRSTSSDVDGLPFWLILVNNIGGRMSFVVGTSPNGREESLSWDLEKLSL